ncbi:MAG TPA: hypothetical protein VMA77_23385 [Solirubrobacteraceae bacterium]|nr:hypothetical protein [Solirubrobacteraceae bacterium]
MNFQLNESTARKRSAKPREAKPTSNTKFACWMTITCRLPSPPTAAATSPATAIRGLHPCGKQLPTQQCRIASDCLLGSCGDE